MRLTPLAPTLLALLGTARGAEPAASAALPPQPPHRIVLTFANPVLGVPARAGSSISGYGGASYLLGQSAHAVARHIAKQYALKEVASWPIQALAVHCVVYEVRAGEDVQGLLVRLNRDARVTLAQSLQDFHTRLASLPAN
jgi:hypothetical protein